MKRSIWFYFDHGIFCFSYFIQLGDVAWDQICVWRKSRKGKHTCLSAPALKASLNWQFWLGRTDNPLNKCVSTCCFSLLNSLCYGVREPRPAPLQGEALVRLQPSLASAGLVVSARREATWSRIKRSSLRLQTMHPNVARLSVGVVSLYDPISFILFIFNSFIFLD